MTDKEVKKIRRDEKLKQKRLESCKMDAYDYATLHPTYSEAKVYEATVKGILDAYHDYLQSRKW